ncbi:DUF2157 domain-containing protein [Deinococcus radiophilus]|uniref:DUF2157 domain-containing protein n=1 Tax=Deinococcus radiophilus TaxID=32062 RepID=A0A3S0I7T9_9DEIO|nr:DUF2157 domain-containing protein [Deinococcus radiophilus]RTR29410.1 DUF2157 domain-containing protein [Deinococcus radiophilus]
MPDSSPTLTVRHRALREQLARWQAAGLLSAEQAAAIWNHEQQREGHTPSRPPWAVTVSVIGALVLGLGLIALVAANWDGLSRTVRLVGLIALMLGSYAVGYRLRDRPAGRWPGTGAAFYLLGGVLFGGLLAFLAQGLQLDIPLTALLLLWGAGLAALAYAVRLPAALHLALPLGAVIPLLALYSDGLNWLLGLPPGVQNLWLMGLVGGLFLAAAGWHDRPAPSGQASHLTASHLTDAERHALGHPYAFWGPPLLLGAATALLYHGLLPSDALWQGQDASAAYLLIQGLAGVLALSVAYLGQQMERRAVINWGLLGVGASVLGIYFSLFSRLLNISLVLIGAGILLLALGYLLERARRRLSEGLG